MTTNKRYHLQIHIAVLLFGMASIFARVLTLSPIVITFFRVSISSVTLLIWQKGVKRRTDGLGLKKSSLDKRSMTILLGAGFVLAIHWSSFLASVQMAGVAIGTFTFATFPLFVTLLAQVIFKDRITKVNMVASLMIIIGVIVMGDSAQMTSGLGFLLGMVSSFSYAVLALMHRYLIKHIDAVTIALYEQAIAAVILLPSLMSISQKPLMVDWFYLVLIGVVCTAIAHVTYINTLKYITVQYASIISGMEPVYSIVMGMVLLYEFPNLNEIVGGAIILGTIVYTSLKSNY